MAQNIRLKRSATAAKVPLTTDLALGELAINTRDGKMYLKKDNGTASIIQLANDNEVVKLTGTQIITGEKLFTDLTKISNNLLLYPIDFNSSSTGKIINFWSGSSATDGGKIRFGVSWTDNSLQATPKGSIENLKVPTTDYEAANKKYVDDQVATKANTTHSHAASDITSGTIATARLGSGTANSTTFLRGDNTWQTISGSGTVTSVTLSGGTTGLTVSGSPITTSGTITLAGTLAVANGGTGATTAANARTNLGATTVGSNLFTLTNPSAVRYIQINANNTIEALSASDFRQSIGAGTGNGTVLDVLGTTNVVSISTGTLSTGFTKTVNLVAGHGDTVNPYASKTANHFLAAPNGTAGAPTFRAINGSDITAGTIATARLGSGTANSTTFLRGDNTWQSISGGVSDGDKGDITVSNSGATWTVDSNAVVKLTDNQTIAGVKTFSSDIILPSSIRIGAGPGGTNNVVFGNNAGLVLTTGGNENVAIGNLALDANTTGYYNTAIGYNALSAITTNFRCTAVGWNALANNTGDRNTAVGANALGATTTGTFNVAVGNNALGANTEGGGNMAIGNAALNACTTGGSNTAIGTGALFGVTTTNNNVGLGNNAGRWLLDGTTVATQLANCVYIGGGIRANSDNESNSIVIGANQNSDGSNTTVIGNAETVSTKLFGKVTGQTNTATTNAVVYGLRSEHQSTNTPAVGIGTGIEFAAETSAGNTEVGALIEAVTTDVTAGSEDFDIVFDTMTNGAAATEKFRISSDGAVKAEAGYRIGSSALNAQTTAYTLAASDNGKIITINTSSEVNLTVGTAVGSTGFSCTVIQLGAGQVTIAASSTTLNSYNGLKLAGQHAAATLVCYTTNTFNVAGNLKI